MTPSTARGRSSAISSSKAETLLAKAILSRDLHAGDVLTLDVGADGGLEVR